jgi:hypothetical protein
MVINAWIIYTGVTGGKTSRHAFLSQLAEELREVHKQKRESMVPNTMKKSSRRTKEKQAKGISVK